LDVATITAVEFKTSSIYAIPPEIFTKFRNLKAFYAFDQNIQEIRAETLENAKKMETFSVSGNDISQLHPDTFKRKQFT
jgi:Leucine-rich repeat (LRR) protein